MEYDGTLENMRIRRHLEGWSAWGDIYGDKKERFPDGTEIRTSKILWANFAEGWIKTKNSLYKIGS